MGAFNRGVREIVNGGHDFLTSSSKVVLLGTGTPYTYNPDHDVMDAGGASDPTDAEIGVAGYSGGFGGAGRKTLGSKTVTEDDANNRTIADAADVFWAALGVGATLDAALLIQEITNDAASILLGHFELTNTPTNGSDVSLQWNAAGLFTFNTI